MKLHQMRYLVAAIEYGSMAKAARQLNIAGPALTQQLNALEESVDVKLLHRSVNGVTPTAVGELFYDSTLDILQRVDQLRKQVHTSATTISGDVRLLLSSTIIELVLPELLKEATIRFPDIKLIVNSGTGGLRTSTELLHVGHVDLAVMPGKTPDTGIKSQTILSQRLYFLQGRSLLNRDQSKLFDMPFSNIQEYNLALPHRSNRFRSIIEDDAKDAGFSLNVGAESADALVLQKLVESGLYCTILPEVMANKWHNNSEIKATPIVKPEIWREYSAYWASASPMKKRVQVIKDLLFSVTSQHCSVV